jgi:nucleoside 2-deoxyribosyltransferase
MSGYKDRSRKLARESYWQRHDRDSYECPDCGRTEDEIQGRFEVHHKNGEPLDNRPENRVGLCRLCHNLREDKKPSIEQIRNARDGLTDDNDQDDAAVAATEVESVYLAGTMSYREDDSWWTSATAMTERDSAHWRQPLPEHAPLRLNSPQDVHFDHGADLVEGVAKSDLELLDNSDGVVAYFDKEEQVGTLTELVYAISEGKPALVLFHRRFVQPPAIDPFGEIDASHQFLQHPVGMRFESPIYWFLLNFLLGDRDYDGVEADVTVAVVAGKEAVPAAYEDWFLNEVDSDD